MLELLSINKDEENATLDTSFYFRNEATYRGRITFDCYFHIKDEENKIIYIYTQEDIEKNFFYNNIEIKGLEKGKDNSHLIGIEKGYKVDLVRHLYLNDDLYKVIYGTNVSSFTTTVVYKTLNFWHGARQSFKDLSYDWNISYDKFVKDKDNYGLFYNRNDFSYYKNYSCELKHPIGCSVKDIVEIINEWRTFNKINTYRHLFEYCDEEVVDIRNLDTKGIFDFNNLFRYSYNMKILKFCDLDMSMPIILENMLFRCRGIEQVDFTKLSNDYPEDNYGIPKMVTEANLLLGLISGLDSKRIIFIFNDKTPRFTKQLVERNMLNYLGTVKKGNYNLETVMAKKSIKW